MGTFSSVIVTKKGIQLMSNAMSKGIAVAFTKVKTGNGVYTGSEVLADATGLKSLKESFGISTISAAKPDTILVRSALDNINNNTSYNITELGIFANDSNGVEVLFAITTSSVPEPFPAFSQMAKIITVDLYVNLTASTNPTFTIDGNAGVYVNVKDLDDKLNNQIKSAEGTFLNLTNTASGGIRLLVKGKLTEVGTGTKSPDNPYVLKGIGESGTVNVTACGKNLINVPEGTEVFINKAYTLYGIKAEDNITITISQTLKSLNGIGMMTAQHWINFYDAQDNKLAGHSICPITFSAIGDTKVSSATKLVPSGCVKIVIDISAYYAANSPTLTTNYVQIEYGTTATAYEPYKEKTAPVTFTTPIYDLDTLEKRNGIWGIYRNKMKSVFKGAVNEEWVIHGAWSTGNVLDCYIDVPNRASGATNVTSNRFVTKPGVPTDNCILGESGTSKIHVAILKSLLTTSDITGFKIWLQSNQVIIIYKLATPTWTPLTMPEQAQLNALCSFDGVTNIFTDDPQNPVLSVDYGTGDIVALGLRNEQRADDVVLKVEDNTTKISEVSTQTTQNKKDIAAHGITISTHTQQIEATTLKSNKTETDLATQIAVAEGSLLNLNGTLNGGIRLLVKGKLTEVGTGTKSPDNPYVLKGVGESGTVKVTTCGKNLLKNMTVASTMHGITYTVNADGSITATGTRTGTTYVDIFGKISAGATTVFILRKGITYYGFDSHNLSFKTKDGRYLNMSNSNPYTPTEDTEIVGFYLEVLTSDTLPMTFYPMMCIGVKPTTYEPYKEKTVPVTFTTPIYDLDTLEKRNGVWGIYRDKMKSVFQGAVNEEWITSASWNNETTMCFKISAPGKNPESGNLVSSRFAYLENAYINTYTQTGVSGSTMSDGIFVRIMKTSLSTADAAGFKTWLSNHQSEFVFKLATPTWTPLTQAEQIQLNELCSFDGVTNVFTDDPSAPVLKVGYGKNDIASIAILDDNLKDSTALKIAEDKQDLVKLRDTIKDPLANPAGGSGGIIELTPTFTKGRISTSTGEIREHATYMMTAKIPMSSDITVANNSGSSLAVLLYDANQAFITAWSDTYNFKTIKTGESATISTSTGAKYYVLNVTTDVEMLTPNVKVTSKAPSQYFEHKTVLFPDGYDIHTEYIDGNTSLPEVAIESKTDFNVTAVKAGGAKKEATVCLSLGAKGFVDLSCMKYDDAATNATMEIVCQARGSNIPPTFIVAFKDATSDRVKKIQVDPDAIPVFFTKDGLKVRKTNAANNTFTDADFEVIDLISIKNQITTGKVNDSNKLGGKLPADFRQTSIAIVTNKDYNTFENGIVYAATGCTNNPPSDYCIVETNIATNGDGYQNAFDMVNKIMFRRSKTATTEWTAWADVKDGGNARSVGGWTAEKLLKDIGATNSSELNIDTFNEYNFVGYLYLGVQGTFPTAEGYWHFQHFKTENPLYRYQKARHPMINKEYDRLMLNGVWQPWVDKSNAVTLGGKTSTEFVQNFKGISQNTNILTWANSIGNHEIGICRIFNATGVPTNYGYTDGDNDFWVEARSISPDNNSDYRQLTIWDIRSNNIFYNSKRAGVWQGWTATNAATLGGKTATDFVAASKIAVQATAPTAPTAGTLWIW